MRRRSRRPARPALPPPVPAPWWQAKVDLTGLLSQALRSLGAGLGRWLVAHLAPAWQRLPPRHQLWLLRLLAVVVVGGALIQTLTSTSPRSIPTRAARLAPSASTTLTTPLDTIQAYNAASILGDAALMQQLAVPGGPLWTEIQTEAARRTQAGEIVTSSLDRWGVLAEATTAQTATLDLTEQWTTTTRIGAQIVATDRAILIQNRYLLVRAGPGAAPGITWQIDRVLTTILTN